MALVGSQNVTFDGVAAPGYFFTSDQTPSQTSPTGANTPSQLAQALVPLIGANWYTFPVIAYSDTMASPLGDYIRSFFPVVYEVSRPQSAQYYTDLKVNGISAPNGYSAVLGANSILTLNAGVSSTSPKELPGFYKCSYIPVPTATLATFQFGICICDSSAFVNNKFAPTSGNNYHPARIDITFVYNTRGYPNLSCGYSVTLLDNTEFINRYNDVSVLYDGGIKPYEPIPDPYENGGTSDENAGGDGTFDGASDQIADSTLPTISAANTGFTRIYNPSLAQVQALANYLWTDQTIVQTLWNHIKQFLENPMDAFIAFNLVPCAVPDGGTTEFKVMYIGTGVNMTAAASQFVDVDCGTLDIDEYYGSALDYAPNTKISVFLPFIGTVQLDTDDVMGKTIGVKYRIDIVSGGCVAKIIVDGSIHYQYSGHCAVNIPFTSADYTGYISAMLQAAKVGSTIASAGASAAAATAEEGVAIPEMAAAGATAAEMMEASRAYDRRIVGSGIEGATQATFNSLAPKNISNTVGVVMSSKPVVERSGSFSGNTGYLGIRRPFCIIERPRMCNPSGYGKYNGRPAMLTMSLGDCSGFTKVQQVQLTGIPATNPELDEIGAFLKGGVIL